MSSKEDQIWVTYLISLSRFNSESPPCHFPYLQIRAALAAALSRNGVVPSQASARPLVEQPTPRLPRQQQQAKKFELIFEYVHHCLRYTIIIIYQIS